MEFAVKTASLACALARQVPSLIKANQHRVCTDFFLLADLLRD